MSKTEIEIKLPVKDIVSTLRKIRELATYSHSEYIRDVIYGLKGVKDKKIRLRYSDSLYKLNIEAIYKGRAGLKKNGKESKEKIEIEKHIYSGNSPIEALSSIMIEGKYKEENSYEKMRVVFIHQEVLITLDIYPYGNWLEIESESKRAIWSIAKQLGYAKGDAITDNADELYLKWNKKAKHKELWDVRFGLNFR